MVALFAVAGLVVGAFLNLCADSLPTVRRLRHPTCVYCGRPRPALAWSAVVAILTGQQRCLSCAAPFPLRHVLVELTTALLFAFTWLQTGPTLATLFSILYGSVFVFVLVTDIEHHLILHVVMLPSLILALLGAWANPAVDSPKHALLGGAIGLCATLALYVGGILFAWWLGRLRGQPVGQVAFGFGDVTLTTFIGLIVGAPEILFALALGILFGGVYSAAYLLLRGLVQRRYEMFTAIAYGPFLILGGVAMLVYGPQVMAWYMP